MAAARGIAARCLALVLAAGTARAEPASPDVFRGSTVETAIVLPGIKDEFHGVAAEHAYIAAHFPTWHLEYQSLFEHDNRHYDVIGLVKPDRAKVPVFFDITDWFGK